MTHHLFICGVFSLKQKVSGSLISVEELISDNWSSKSLITRPYSPKKTQSPDLFGFSLSAAISFLSYLSDPQLCNSYHPNIVLLCCKEKSTEQLKILQFSKLFQVKRLEKFLKEEEKLWSESLKQRTSNICLLAILHWENCEPRCWKVIGCKEKERIPPGICHQSLKEMKKI